MKKTAFIALILLSGGGLSAQNLIKNGMFSEYTKPGAHSQITNATGWSSANSGTPDLYYNHDGCNRFTKTVGNYQGTETGEVYAGFSAYYADEAIDWQGGEAQNNIPVNGIGWGKHAEYLQAELTEPLKGGTTYRISFEVSLSEKSGRAISGLGAYFSNEQNVEANNQRLPVTPQWSESKVMDNKNGWTKISGTFTAQGGEKFVTFGAFDKNFSEENVAAEGNDNQRAYYFVKGGHLKIDDGHPDYNELLSGVSMVIPKIFFETGNSNFKAKSFAELDYLAKWLNANPEKNAEISGHTDKSGSLDFNMELSKKRANAVREYLVGKGVNASRLTHEGFGPNRPIDTSGDQHNNAKNRRVEIRLLK